MKQQAIRRFPYRSKRDDIPLCGAQTRKGSHCRNLAMPNGRCRMHGGQSLRGRRHPNYKHGFYCKNRPPSSHDRVVGPTVNEILARIVAEDATDLSQKNLLSQALEGFVKLRGSQRDQRQLVHETQLQRPPISARNYQSCRVAVPSVHAELSRCRGSAG